MTLNFMGEFLMTCLSREASITHTSLACSTGMVYLFLRNLKTVFYESIDSLRETTLPPSAPWEKMR